MSVKMKASVGCDRVAVGVRAYDVADGFVEAEDYDVVALEQAGFAVALDPVEPVVEVEAAETDEEPAAEA